MLFHLISVLLGKFRHTNYTDSLWSSAFSSVEGPSNGLQNSGSMEETGAMIGEDNGGGSGEFEDEDEIDWEEGWEFIFFDLLL